jgi:hypothetical protein
MSVQNFFAVLAGPFTTQFVAKSGNVYTPVNGIITNVAPGDIGSPIKSGMPTGRRLRRKCDAAMGGAASTSRCRAQRPTRSSLLPRRSTLIPSKFSAMCRFSRFRHAKSERSENAIAPSFNGVAHATSLTDLY